VLCFQVHQLAEPLARICNLVGFKPLSLFLSRRQAANW
jgi:hypothetical protein